MQSVLAPVARASVRLGPEGLDDARAAVLSTEAAWGGAVGVRVGDVEADGGDAAAFLNTNTPEAWRRATALDAAPHTLCKEIGS